MTDSPAPTYLAVAEAAVHIVSVRGSTEEQSGSHMLGPVADEISAALPGRAAHTELTYPATFELFDGNHPARFELGDSPRTGVRELLRVLHDGARQRPAQHVALLGWSQGAQVITDTLLASAHRAAATAEPPLDPLAAQRIAAIALYGNPRFTAGEQGNAGTHAPGVSGSVPYPAGPVGPRAASA